MNKGKQALITIIKWICHILPTVFQWILKGLRIMLRIILTMLTIVATINFVAIPFLNTLINSSVAQWIWYPSCIFMALSTIVGCIRATTSKEEPPLFDFLGKWGLVTIVISLVSVFVFNYYNIDYIWKWILFSIVAICAPLFFLTLLSFDWNHNQRTPEDKKTASLNTCKNILLYWLFDLFYLSIFNNWLIPKYIFGILALVIVGFNLTNTFLHGTKSLLVFVVLELINTLITAGYLIWIIPDKTLQNIVLTISAALLGGVFTLLGVAWTIKKGDADRQADLLHIEETRKEETRRKYIPYIKLANDVLSSTVARVDSTNSFGSNDEGDFSKTKDGTVYSSKINLFTIRNVSGSNILLKGIYINDTFHPFVYDTLVENDRTSQVQVGINYWFTSSEKVTSIQLLITDILFNEYVVDCQFYEEVSKIPQERNDSANKKYAAHRHIYSIESVSLPRWQQHTADIPSQ